MSGFLRFLFVGWVLVIGGYAGEPTAEQQSTPEKAFTAWKEALRTNDRVALKALMVDGLEKLEPFADFQSLFQPVVVLETKADGDVAVGILTTVPIQNPMGADDLWFVRVEGRWCLSLGMKDMKADKDAWERLWKWAVGRMKELKAGKK